MAVARKFGQHSHSHCFSEVIHSHGWPDHPHSHLLRAICTEPACAGGETHDKHEMPSLLEQMQNPEVKQGIDEGFHKDPARINTVDFAAKSAYWSLTSLRNILGDDITEAQDTAILDILDLLTGWCAADQVIGSGIASKES